METGSDVKTREPHPRKNPARVICGEINLFRRRREAERPAIL